MNSNNGGKDDQERLMRNKVARAIFSAADSVGISDRVMIEQLTDQVINRLENRPLPGMEHLVPKMKRRPIADAEIQSLVKSILAESKPAPTPPKKKPLPKASTGTKIEVKEKVDPAISINARTVLERRYLRKDDRGQIAETVEDMFLRVAHHIAAADSLYDPKADITAREDEFYQAMINMEFLPNSPTLMNAGQKIGQLSACFVLPVYDTMESIFETIKHTALIHKSGGGTGFSFSRLRHAGDLVGSTGGVASGPVSFMRAFDAATDVIKQGGKRRGANMAILNIDHPDIQKFITAKEDNTSLTNFNISVAITEKFMEAVKSGSSYDLISSRTGEAVSTLNAKEVFNQIVDMAWRNGDPGIVFIDRINKDNPTKHLGDIESTNPCGEQPLLPYESCNLGSLNLSKMVLEQEGKLDIDWDKLTNTVKMAVRFLDNVIDVNKFPIPKIEEMTKATRKIGLGVMGFADLLIQLKIPYDSKEALETARSIMKFVSTEATNASIELAEERGVFPAFEGSEFSADDGLKIRNATRTTIAPTGTLSIIAGCSSGIEPLFALSYMRNILDGDRLIEGNPLFEKAAREGDFYSEDLMKSLAEGASIRDMEKIPEYVKKLFVTAHDISPEWHVKMQAAFQTHTNNAVSKTVNFPHHATRDDVAQVYMLAYKEDCKGITIYRDRSRDTQVLSTGSTKPSEAPKLVPRKRLTTITGFTRKVTTGCGNLYITVNSDEGGICEVFAILGNVGGCASAHLQAMSRVISGSLRAGMELASVIKYLRGIRCPSISWDNGHAILSCPDAIASVLDQCLNGNNGNNNIKNNNPIGQNPAGNVAGQCPDCGSLLTFQEGCFICPGCGYTKC
ncbi:vitamin B12-dependent ribonucleotide reductase [Chloroflexota bacterium]